MILCMMKMVMNSFTFYTINKIITQIKQTLKPLINCDSTASANFAKSNL